MYMHVLNVEAHTEQCVYVVYYIILFCIVLCCTVLYYIVLYCTVLYYIVLYCVVLYCSVLHQTGGNTSYIVMVKCSFFLFFNYENSKSKKLLKVYYYI